MTAPQIVEKIVSNILSNAIKFSPEGDLINISIKIEGSEVVLCIHDNGPGVSGEDKERLFRKFQKLSRVATIKMTTY